MQFLIIFLIVFVLMIGFNIAGSLLARRYVDNLNRLQYEDPQGCLKKLEGFPAKFLLPGYNRELVKADIYARINDETNLKATFEKLNAYADKKHSMLNIRDKAMVYQKQLSYALYKHDQTTAHLLNTKLQALKTNKHVDDLTNRLIDESNTCVQVYIDHNYAYLDKAKQHVDSLDNKVVSGIMHYRMAYLYHTRNDQNHVKTHLEKATTLLKGSELENVIQQVNQNHGLLDTVAI